jgi:hypothetical protein
MVLHQKKKEEKNSSLTTWTHTHIGEEERDGSTPTLSDLFPTIIFTASAGASLPRSANHHEMASKDARLVTS